MAYKLCAGASCYFNRSSDEITLPITTTTTISDGMLSAYSAMIQPTPPEPPQNPKIQTANEVTEWRKSSLTSKLNTLLAELEKNMAEQKVTKDRQILIQLKERELALIIEVNYIETTMIRLELSSLRGKKN